MKKILTILLVIIGVFTLSGCNNESSDDGNETVLSTIPSVSILSTEVINQTASFTLNVYNTSNAVVELILDGVVVETISLEEGINQTVTFGNLVQNTTYSVDVLSGDFVLYQTSFTSGFWPYNAGTALIETLTPDNGIVVVNLTITDVDNTLSNIRVELVKDVSVIDFIEVSKDVASVQFEGLNNSQNYTVRITADSNTGTAIVKHALLSSDEFMTGTYENAPQVMSVEFDDTASSGDLITGIVTFDNPEGYEITSIIVNHTEITSFESYTDTSIEVLLPAEYEMRINGFTFDNGFYEETITEYGMTDNVDYVEIQLDQDGDVYLIHDTTEFLAINQDLTADYRMENDITFLLNYLYTPIGIDTDDGFTGSLDGNGYAISNVRFIDNLRSIGLFSRTTNATIHDLDITLMDGMVQTEGPIIYLGGLSGFAVNTNITNVSVSGTVLARCFRHDYALTYYTGGLVGRQDGGTITDATSTAWIYSFGGFSQYNGGMVGYSENVDYIRPTIHVEHELVYSSSYFYQGGVAGLLDASTLGGSTVTDASVVIDSLQSKEAYYFGGVAGYVRSNVTIEGSTVWINQIVSTSRTGTLRIGGVAAINEGVINDSVVTIDAENDNYSASSMYLGGIAAINQIDDTQGAVQASITNSVVRIKSYGLSCSETVIGGMAALNLDGYIAYGKSEVTISGAFNYIYVGGIVGDNRGKLALVEEVDGTVTSDLSTSLYVYIIGGIAAMNKEDSTIKNVKGTVNNAYINVYQTSSTSYQQYAFVGGVVGENTGIIDRAIGSISATINNPKTTAIGGIAGVNLSLLVASENADEGGTVKNTVVTFIDVVAINQVSSILYYGNIIGDNQVSDTASIGGVSDSYYSDQLIGYVIEEVDIEEQTMDYLVDQDMSGVSTDQIHELVFYQTLFGIGIWTIDEGLPELIVIGTLRGVE